MTIALTTNRKAFLQMIAVSELGQGLIEASDDGYNVIVGSTTKYPDLFDSYADHPRKLVRLSALLSSTAAGRYQLLARYFDAYKKSLGLLDFGKASQDAIALQQIYECQALGDIDAGRIIVAIQKCAHIWASLPGNSYGQHQNGLALLTSAYTKAGGDLA
jgi:muramidase (phage lysozyme)